MGDKLSGGSPREGARSELARGAATGGGGPQGSPDPDHLPSSVAGNKTYGLGSGDGGTA
jgi:hypothetical protein